MKSLNEAWSESSRQIDRAFDLDKAAAPDNARKARSGLAARVAPRPAGPDASAILGSIEQVERELDDYDFDSTEYNEVESRNKLDRLGESLIAKGVPKSVVDAGLRQPRADLGRRGVRHILHWNAQKPIHRRRVQRSFTRMKSLVAPVAAAQDRLRAATGSRDLLRQELGTANADLARLRDQKAGLEAHGVVMGLDEEDKEKLAGIDRQIADPATDADMLAELRDAKARLEGKGMAAGLGRYSQEALAKVDQEIADLEDEVKYSALALDDTEQEIAELEALVGKFGGDDSSATSHFGRVQVGLDRVGAQTSFVETYDKLNPGARRSRFKGYLAKRFAHPVKSFAKKVAAVVTLTGSSVVMGWYGAIKAQDKARRFATAQHQLPTPAARMMAAVLLDRFDAEAYKKGFGAAMATAHLPIAIHIPGVFNLATGPISSAVGTAATSQVHNEIKKDIAKDAVGDAYGEVKSEGVDKTRNQLIRKVAGRRDTEPFPMPTVPIRIRDSGQVKHVDLTDKKTALALLIHLGPAVRQDRIDAGDEAEIARRDLRREIFKADDQEHFGADAKGRIRSAKGREFDRKLMKALFDPEHQNRDDVLRQATPLHKMFAAAGLL